MKKVLCYLLLLALTLTLMPAATFSADVTFTDLNGHWAKNYVLPLAQDGIISGKAPGIFDPDAQITRAEFITLVAKLTNLHPDEAAPYADVAENAWFAKTVSAAKAYGAIDGNLVADGNFKPDQPITRAEMTSVIVLLAEEIRGALLNKKEGFTDAATFADWTKDYIAKAAGEGIVTGNPDGSFNAVGNATRAEAAVIIKRFRDLLNQPVRKLEAGEYHPSYDAPIFEVDLQKMIEDAYAAGQKSLTLEKGAYRLKIRTDASHLHLKGMKDFTLDANGSTLLCGSTSGTGLTLTDCENVTIKNLNIDYEKLCLYQARITAVNEEDGYFEIIVPNGYRDYFDDNSAMSNTMDLRVFHSDGDFNRNFYNPATVTFSGFKKLGDRQYRVNSMKIVRTGISVGDYLAGGYKPAVRSAVSITNSKLCKMDNIGVWGGCVGIGMSGGYGGHSLNNYRVEPGPRPLGATEDRVLSTIADCAHINYMEVGPTIENSLFANAGDDGFNCYGTFYRVAERISDTEIVLAARDRWSVKEGDKLRFYSADAIFKDTAEVKSITTLTDYTPKADLRIDMGVVMFVAETYYKVQMTAAKGLAAGDWITNTNANCNGFVIRNNTYKNIVPRGILIKGSDGLIENNYIYNCGHAGILLAPEFSWLESDYVRNVTVRNNTIDSCGFNYGDHASIEVMGQNGWHNENIVIEGNTIRNSKNEDMELSYITGLTVRNNIIEAPHPDAKAGLPSILLDKVDGAVFSGNVWKTERTEIREGETKNVQK